MGQKKQQVPDSAFITSGEGSLREDRLGNYLSTIFDPVDLKVKHWREIQRSALTAYIQAGPVIVRHWSPDGKETYSVLPAQEGYCLSFTFQTEVMVHKRISVVVFGSYRLIQPFSLSLRCNIKISVLLAFDSSAYLAAEQGNWLVLRQLLAASQVSISDRTKHGEGLLHIATRGNHVDLVMELLRTGADVNATNDFGETPLHLAVQQKVDFDIARCLIDSGANLHHQDLDQRTPLHSFFNTTSQQIIQFYQDDIDTTIQDYMGRTIAHYVSWSKTSSTTDILRCLKNTPSQLHHVDEEGRTMLHFTLKRGNLELIYYLLNQPTTPLFQLDIRGRTLLHYATESRRTQTINDLLERGFDIHAKDLRGRTVLHHAASKGNLDAVKRLLELGAASDLGALDRDSRTPLQLAAMRNAHKVVTYLQPLCEPQELVFLGRAEWQRERKRATLLCNRALRAGSLSIPFYIIIFCLGFLVCWVSMADDKALIKWVGW